MKFTVSKRSNVISIMQHQARSQVYAATAQVEGYWNALYDRKTLPRRADVDPRALESALEYTFILQHIAPGIARFRVAGQHLTQLMGLDVRGMPLTAMFDPAARIELSRIVQTVVTDPCICEVFIQSAGTFGRGVLTGKLFLAPLLDEAGQMTRILGCFQTNGTIGRQPRRFSITEIRTKSLSNVPNEYASLAIEPKKLGFAEPATRFATRENKHSAGDKQIPARQNVKKEPDEKRPVLKLVVSET